MQSINDVIAFMGINNAPHWEIRTTGHGSKVISRSPENPNLDHDQAVEVLRSAYKHLGNGRYNFIMRQKLGPDNTKGGKYETFFVKGGTDSINQQTSNIGALPMQFDQEASLRREFELQKQLMELQHKHQMEEIKRQHENKQPQISGVEHFFINTEMGQQLTQVFIGIASQFAANYLEQNKQSQQQQGQQKEKFEGF